MVSLNESDEARFARREIGVREDRVTDVTANDIPGHYADEEDAWSLDNFKSKFDITIGAREGDDIEFDMIGVDAAIANAFRRILIAEIPTMAIENVYIMNNTSVIQDEVLAHRLGLVPIKANPDQFQWLFKPEGSKEPPAPTDYDTVVMTLKVKCEHNKEASSKEEDPDKLYINSKVYARDLVWQPQGRQESVFADDPIRALNPDILIAKLRPGQEIDLSVHCVLGVAQDHAKFSPVATASYRLLPSIHILQPIVGQDAHKFARCFPRGVIALEGEGEDVRAVVANPRKDTVSREVLRHAEFKDKVRLGRVRDHFIFSIESVGVTPPDELFLKSIQVLREKCQAVKASLTSQLNKD